MKRSQILMISFLLCAACGNSKKSDSSSSVQNEQGPEASDEQTRYSDVVMVAEGFGRQYSHEIKIDLDRSDVYITGNFQSEEEAKSCGLMMNLNEFQSKKLKRLTAELIICTNRSDSDIIIDSLTNGIGLTTVGGKTDYANKELSGQNGEKYLCQGKVDFYQYLKTLIQASLQKEECPKNILGAFF